ncbi:uncharacterized protein UTRI_05069 [Ustilago trichophora]|uniref:DUF1754-domain-containing protein n=1 Tax=Ustilago trichophora TaxID=86804 RepID=A0A5C3EE52_9BASI|nr:uncharacterized protein UTRI_05069 [Ustilago trichophora]
MSGSSAYAFKPGGSLKLKGDDGKKDKKKKKKVKSSLSHDSKHTSSSASASSSKQKASEDDLDQVHNSEASYPAEGESSGATASGRMMTEAERKFEEVRKKRMHQRIAKEARTSHKEKVDAFNKYLGSLSEHHDIPKVGPG